MSSDNYRDTKTPPREVTVSDYCPEGWHWSGYSADWERPIIRTPGESLLHEQKSPDESGPRSSWKNWEHHKVASAAYSGGSSATLGRLSWWPDSLILPLSFDAPYAFYNGCYGEPGKCNTDLPLFAYEGDQAGHFVVQPDGLQELVGKAVQGLLPTMKPELSLVNSLIELKDFKSLKHSLARIRTLQKAILPITAATLTGKAPLRDVLRLLTKSWYSNFTNKKSVKWVSWQGAKVLADAYLQDKFNIEPLISDIKAIHTALSTSEKRLRRLINGAGRVQRAHWAHSWTEFPDRDEYLEYGGPDRISPWADFRLMLNAVGWRRLVINSPTKFHAEVLYSYTLTDFQLAHAQVLGFLDTLGVNLNPVIIWNALPWSFVVDWVLGVNTWLNAQRFGNMDPVINIHKFLHSVSRSRSIYVERKTALQDDSGKLTWKTTNCPAIHETSYRRSVGIPDAAYFRVSGLSSTEVKLGAALGVSLHNPYRKRR